MVWYGMGAEMVQRIIYQICCQVMIDGLVIRMIFSHSRAIILGYMRAEEQS